MVDSTFEKPKTTEEIRKRGGWGSHNEDLLRKEKERVKNQKEKNNEYLPLFDAFYKALKYINQQ